MCFVNEYDVIIFECAVIVCKSDIIMWNLNVLLCINITDNDSAACSNSTTIQLPLTTTAVLLLAAPSLQLRKEHDSMGLT